MSIKMNGQLTSSVQRVILEVLQDPSYRWLPYFSGDGALRTKLGSDLVSVSFVGKDVVREGDTIIAGTVSKILLYAPGATKPTAVVKDFGELPFADLIDLAADVPGFNQPLFDNPEFGTFRDFLASPTTGLTVNGSNRKDVLEGTTGIDLLNGRGGNDVFVIRDENKAGTAGPDIFKGGKGKKDMFDASEMKQGIEADFSTGEVIVFDELDGRTIANFQGMEGINATMFTDRIIGDNKANIILAGKGDDFVDGGGGNDIIKAGKGKDKVFGGGGNDAIETGDGADFVVGGKGNDRIYSGSQNDFVYGDTGNDTLNGGAGKDNLYGGKGSDTLDGGTGNDLLLGGRGEDFFHFTVRPLTGNQGKDRIFDFEKNDDTLRIIGDLNGTVEVTQKFGNTIIDYGNGTIVLDDVLLTEAEINIEFVDDGF